MTFLLTVTDTVPWGFSFLSSSVFYPGTFFAVCVDKLINNRSRVVVSKHSFWVTCSVYWRGAENIMTNPVLFRATHWEIAAATSESDRGI